MTQSPGGVLEVGGCENVDVSEVRGSGLLRGAAAVPGPRLAPRLPPVRGVRQGPQPRHTRGGEPEHVVYSLCVYRFYQFCEAQGKGRARGGPWKVTQRSFMDGGWWMVDILSLMLYTKVGCHPPKV